MIIFIIIIKKMSNLKTLYYSQIQKKLQKKFNDKNINQVSKLKKIVIHRNFGAHNEKDNIVQTSINEFIQITGQIPIKTYSKKAISNFKIQKNTLLGIKVTLRNTKMYTFLYKLIHFVLPQIENFQGLHIKSFDKNGNFNFGLENLLIFPEIEYDETNEFLGCNISIHLTTNSQEKNIALLTEMRFPLKLK